jgi:hypothetical protein
MAQGYRMRIDSMNQFQYQDCQWLRLYASSSLLFSRCTTRPVGAFHVFFHFNTIFGKAVDIGF